MDKKLIIFDNWYQSQYDILKRQVFVRSPIDQDAFHDAYLKLRSLVMFSNEDIIDYAPFFIMVYRNVRRKAEFQEKRYVHPEDFFFQVISALDESHKMIERKLIQEELYDMILKFVKERYPADYRIFCLKVIKPCCSYRELELYTGIPAGVIRKKIIRIITTIKKEMKYETNCLQ